MRAVNRSSITLRFREPYIRWAASIDEKAADHAEELRDDVSVYLVPEDPAGEEESAPIEEYFQEIFENELAAWCRDESLWPSRRDFATFCTWFEIRATSIVTDLGSESLEIEELEG